MSTEHAHWLERGDIYALGALDGEELKDFQAHLAMDCAMCAAYLRETRETLNLLHRSLRPITPRLELKARLLEKVRSEKVVPIAALQPKSVAVLAANHGNDRRWNYCCRSGRRVLPISQSRGDQYRGRQFIARSVDPRSAALRCRGQCRKPRAISLERFRRGSYLRRQFTVGAARKNLRGVDDCAQLRPALRRRTQHRRERTRRWAHQINCQRSAH